ncbi:hypothetical protein EDD22DRAFT_855534, partial [Suillus occidentalis]
LNGGKGCVSAPFRTESGCARVIGATESFHRSTYESCKVSTAREGSMGKGGYRSIVFPNVEFACVTGPELLRRTGSSPRLMVSANSEEGAMCFLDRARRQRMRARMSNTRATTPPMAPPAMAPALIFEVEEVVSEPVVFPDVIDAAAAAADDDADGSAEDWGDVIESATVVGEGVEEAPIAKGDSEVLGVEEVQVVSGVGEVQVVSGVEGGEGVSVAEEEGVVSGVVVGGGEELAMLVVTG